MWKTERSNQCYKTQILSKNESLKMEKQLHEGMGGGVYSGSSAKVFISFCLEFCLILPVLGFFCSVKDSFLKMRGGLRRVSLEVWTLTRKQGRKGLIEKENLFDPDLTPQASPSAASSRTSFSLFKEP